MKKNFCKIVAIILASSMMSMTVFAAEDATFSNGNTNESIKYKKNNENDKIWWIHNPEQKGERLFTFDKETIFNLFEDYPYKLTPEQKEIFDKENPYWADFFKDR